MHGSQEYDLSLPQTNMRIICTARSVSRIYAYEI